MASRTDLLKAHTAVTAFAATFPAAAGSYHTQALRRLPTPPHAGKPEGGVKMRAAAAAAAAAVVGGGHEDAQPFAGVCASTTDVLTGELVTSWSAFLTESRELLIESPRILASSTKETLITLLECAEEFGCSRVFVCLDATSSCWKQLLRVFGQLGFALCRPDNVPPYIYPATAAYTVLEYDLHGTLGRRLR